MLQLKRSSRTEQTFFQRGHADDQQAYEMMFNIANHQRKTNKNHEIYSHIYSVQFSSVAQSCPTLCNSMNRSMPGLRLSPTPRVHPNPCPVSQWCHPTILSFVVSLSPAFKLSQHWGLFSWVGFSHQVAKVLESLKFLTEYKTPKGPPLRHHILKGEE